MWARHTGHSVAALVLLLLTTACSSTSSDAPSASDGSPERGGTLLILGSSEPDHLLTSSAAQWVPQMLFRTFARQLITYPPGGDFKAQVALVPDLATAIPSRENGGISADYRTYTFHLRRGVRWNTQPPREVTAKDAVLGFKMMCNPVSPYWASGGFFETAVEGWKEYCSAFARVAGTPAAMKRFIETHDFAGVRASDDTTLVFRLFQPASDFLYMIGLTITSPMPVEYLDYLPDGAEFRTHTISNGPYQIVKYVPNRELVLARNPVWDSSNDPMRKAYVDSIRIMIGFTDQSVQQQLQAGTADLSLDQRPPTAQLATLIASNDPNLVIGPSGDAYPHFWTLEVNLLSPNTGAALRQLKVRQAIAYAIDKAAVVQIEGGRSIANPVGQLAPFGYAGFVEGYDPFTTPGTRGDVAKAKQLLADAGFANGLTLKLLHVTAGTRPQIAQAIQAALARAGITIQLVPATISDFAARYLTNPESARRGLWDLAYVDVAPNWYGNNGRDLFSNFDGRTFGPGSWDSGDYDNPAVNTLIDRALATTSDSAASRLWIEAARIVTEDVARIPVIAEKRPMYHSSRTRNCLFSPIFFNCDLNSVWLRGASKPGGKGS